MDQSLTCIAGHNCLLCYLPQRNDGVLVVLPLNHDVRALVDLSRSVRSQQHQFKPVWNLVDAVLDGHARHGMALLAEMQFGEGVVPRPSRTFKAPGNTATLFFILHAECVLRATRKTNATAARWHLPSQRELPE